MTADTPREPVTEAGRLLFEGLLRSRGESYLPQTLVRAILAIEAEMTERHRAEMLTHGQINVGTVYGYEAGIEEGRREARAAGLREGPELRNEAIRFLNVISAAEALGWSWAGTKYLKAEHPITGDLMSAHAHLALALDPNWHPDGPTSREAEGKNDRRRSGANDQRASASQDAGPWPEVWCRRCGIEVADQLCAHEWGAER